MAYFVFFLYFLLAYYLLAKIKFFRQGGLTTRVLYLLFSARMLMGILYAQFFLLPKYNADSDTYRFYRYSLQEVAVLKQHPLLFIQDLFSFGYQQAGHVFSTENSYWNDLKSNVIIKLIAIINLISNNNYYVSIIFFNLLAFTGIVALYNILQQHFLGKKYLLQASLFLIPSFLFWTSGVHKDGLLFSALCLAVYHFHALVNQPLKWKNILGFTMFIVLAFVLRNYAALALVLALFTYAVASKTQKTIAAYLSIYLLGIILFFLSACAGEQFNCLKFLSDRQNEFLLLKGSSAVIQTTLQPTVISFIHYLPMALDMALLRPHLGDAGLILVLPWMLELCVLTLLIVLSILYPQSQSNKPLLWMLMFTAITILLVCGFTVTFSGAIIRYRAVIMPFLVVPLVCNINWNSLKSTNRFNIIKKYI